MIEATDPVKKFLLVFARAGVALVAVLLATANTVPAQLTGGGNSVTGFVFGVDRRPVADVYVELLNDLGQSINRTRTNASGHYAFYGFGDGRYAVKVLPLGTDYEGQTLDFEIDNFRRNTGTNQRITGLMSEQKDFYLKPRKGVMPGVTGVVFAQEIPEDARKFYLKALEQIADKKTNEAYESLKSALEIFPKYFDALELLGVEYVRAGYFDAARILLSIAVDVNPRAYKSWHALASALNSLNAPTEALAAAEKSVEINPVEPQSMFLLGHLLRQAKKYDDSEKRLIKAKELFDGRSADVSFELALLYGNGMKRYRDAARELRTYLKLKPDATNAESIKKLITEFDEKAKTST